MPSMRLNVRISGELAAFVLEMVGENGLYETPSEYIRDLIRKDMQRRLMGDYVHNIVKNKRMTVSKKKR